MDKKSLLMNATALMFAVTSASAQVMTPTNWKFSDMSTGSAKELFIKETCMTAWNLSFPYRAADNLEGAITISSATGGDIVTGGTLYPSLPSAEKSVFDNLIESATIVPGGDLGNLLCLKGSKFNLEDDRGVANTYSAPNTAFWFVSPKNLPLNSAYRISFSMRVIANQSVVGGSVKFTIGTSHWDGIDGTYRDFEAPVYTDFNNDWMTHTMDIFVEDNNDVNYNELPFLVKAYMKGELTDKAMILFKDIKLEKIAEVDQANVPGSSALEDWIDIPSSLDQALAKKTIIWNEGATINVVDASAPIEVYSVTGQLVKSVNPQGAYTQIELDAKGIYVVKVGDKSVKVIF